jgi:putative membrane protein (TIGR04086 family)
MEEKILSENPAKVIIKNLIIEMIISIIMLSILAILLCKTHLAEDIINPAIIFISAFSILIGGFLTSKKLKVKGIISGAVEGIIYMFILYFISSICTSNFRVGFEGLMMIVIGIFAGMLGGIIGANLKNYN